MTAAKINLILLFVLSTSVLFGQSEEYAKRKAAQLAGPSPFQREIDGLVPERILYQDSLVVALSGFPVAAQAPVHLLIIPRKRIPTINDVTETDEPILSRMILVAKKLAKEKGIDQTGYRLTFNTNEDAGQSAFHLHLHLLGGVKTGPMVDQGWRSIQRAKRAKEDTTFATLATKDVGLAKLLGSWQGIGRAFGTNAVISMQWEPAVQFQFIKLTYKIETGSGEKLKTFEGTAMYRPSGTNQYRATWVDSQGSIHPITAEIVGQTLTSLWGTAATVEGKTEYSLKSSESIEIIDYVKVNSGEWKEFSRNALQKLY